MPLILPHTSVALDSRMRKDRFQVRSLRFLSLSLALIHTGQDISLHKISD